MRRLLLVIVAGMLMAGSAVGEEKKEVVRRFSVVEFVNSFHGNEAFRQGMFGKKVEVKGILSGIQREDSAGKSGRGEYLVAMFDASVLSEEKTIEAKIAAEYRDSYVLCKFDESAQKELALLKVGKVITIRGECQAPPKEDAGKAGLVHLKNGVIVDPDAAAAGEKRGSTPSRLAPQWEYKVIQGLYIDASVLGPLGAEGWELAAVEPGEKMRSYIFKRQRGGK